MCCQALFEPADRAFLNGLCAGFAKVGGAIGTSAYKALKNQSMSLGMFSCAVVSAIGMAVTMACVPGRVDEEEKVEGVLDEGERYDALDECKSIQ